MPVGRLRHQEQGNRGCLDKARRFLSSVRTRRFRLCACSQWRWLQALFGLDLDVLAFADLVTLEDVRGIDLVSGLRIYLPIPDAVACLFIDLIEADFLSLAARGK